MARDLTIAEFKAACKRNGMEVDEYSPLGYVKVSDTTFVSRLNGGKRLRDQLAYLIQERNRIQKIRDIVRLAEEAPWDTQDEKIVAMLNLFNYIREVADIHFGIPTMEMNIIELAMRLGVEPADFGAWWDAILAADCVISEML